MLVKFEHRCWECGESLISEGLFCGGDDIKWSPPIDDFRRDHRDCGIEESKQWVCSDHRRSFLKNTNCPDCDMAGLTCMAMGGEGVPARWTATDPFSKTAWEKRQIVRCPDGDYFTVPCADCGITIHKMSKWARIVTNPEGIDWVRCGDCELKVIRE